MGVYTLAVTGVSGTDTTTEDNPYGIDGIVTSVSVDFNGSPATTTVLLEAISDVSASVTVLQLSAGNTDAIYHPTFPAHTTAGVAVGGTSVVPASVNCTHLKLTVVEADADSVVTVKVNVI